VDKNLEAFLAGLIVSIRKAGISVAEFEANAANVQRALLTRPDLAAGYLLALDEARQKAKQRWRQALFHLFSRG
jgi:uncharacterized protein with von Willebrand factor type A (vWA) domain